MPQAELIFGIVGAIGTPIQFFINILEEELRRREYEPETIRLSKLMDAVALSTPAPQNVSEYERLIALIQRGDELRQRGGDDVLAKLALSQINAKRPAQPPSTLDSKAFIIRQLKHPEEVYLLRNVYRDAFHVIGLYSPKLDRQTTLIRHHGMSREQADELMQLDEHENVEFGQRFRDTFHLADVFISQPESGHDTSAAQLTRFFDLLFGARIITPTKDEYGMFLAYAGALRSSSLSRQVGASLLRDGDVLALGTNEVPRFGGGSYWEKDLLQPPPVSGSDGRDHVRKVDSSDEMKREVVAEVLQQVCPGWSQLTPDQQQTRIGKTCEDLKASGARIVNLTEFGRAVHAEMSALFSAARLGMPISGATLYTTTFPCHGCAKHIVEAGLRRVVYIEPYPKSLAQKFHFDSISLDEHTEGAVRFEPFLGIAPRRYADLFSMAGRDGRPLERKDSSGKLLTKGVGLRLLEEPLTYVDREALKGHELQEDLEGSDGGETGKR